MTTLDRLIYLTVTALGILSATEAYAKPWTALLVYDDKSIVTHSAIPSKKECDEVLCAVEFSKTCEAHQSELDEEGRQEKIRKVQEAKLDSDWNATHPNRCKVIYEDGYDETIKKAGKYPMKHCTNRRGNETIYDPHGNEWMELGSMTSGTLYYGYSAARVTMRACFQP